MKLNYFRLLFYFITKNMKFIKKSFKLYLSISGCRHRFKQQIKPGYINRKSINTSFTQCKIKLDSEYFTKFQYWDTLRILLITENGCSCHFIQLGHSHTYRVKYNGSYIEFMMFSRINRFNGNFGK